MKYNIRKNIENLKSYSSARDEFVGEASIYLDANENPFSNGQNRYPDPCQRKLRNVIATIKGIDADTIFTGNGSDEVIDLLIRIFCEPGRDNIITLPPTYGMYSVSAAINNVEVREVPLKIDNFQPNVDAILSAADDNSKLLFICSPNNPTGNLINREDIIKLINGFAGLIVIDEAYIDFSPTWSMASLIDKYDNLFVMQTLSKAWGMAGVRIGIGIGTKSLIQIIDKVKPPYNISVLNANMAIEKLANIGEFENQVNLLVNERKRVSDALCNIKEVECVYPSDANFLLVKFYDAYASYQLLLEQDIVVRNRSNIMFCNNCLRISIGTPQENKMLVEALGGVYSISAVETNVYCAEVLRSTRETAIKVRLNINGSGIIKIDTGLNFFNHMLEQLALHSGVDLTILAKGDLHIDEHHTIEDTAIALGETFLKAIGDKRGMNRYGFSLPMDDCLAQTAIDFGGRPWLVWKVDFKRERIGDVPTEMFYHFFKSFSDAMRANINIQAEGDNEHHKIEAIFKSIARAMRVALKKNSGDNLLPTTKGIL